MFGLVGLADGEYDGSGDNDGEGEEKNTGGTGALVEPPLIDGESVRRCVGLEEGIAVLGLDG